MQSRSLSGRVLDSGNVPTLRREKCSRFGRRRTSSQQSSDSIRISVKTRLRRVLRSMRELGWRETGSRLGLPRRASGPAASRVGPARTLTVVEPDGQPRRQWRECSRSYAGFPMGVKFPPRAYAIHCVHTGTATPDRHRGATSVFGPALVRWRPATARPDHVADAVPRVRLTSGLWTWW